MNAFSLLWQRLFAVLQPQRTSRRLYQLDDRVVTLLQEFAECEQRPEEEVASDLLYLALAQRRQASENLRRWKSLSRREQEVVALACLGYTNREIASRLVISIETVKSHLRSAANKFGLQTKAQLRRALDDWDFSAWDNPSPD